MRSIKLRLLAPHFRVAPIMEESVPEMMVAFIGIVSGRVHGEELSASSEWEVDGQGVATWPPVVSSVHLSFCTPRNPHQYPPYSPSWDQFISMIVFGIGRSLGEDAFHDTVPPSCLDFGSSHFLPPSSVTL